MRSLATVRPAPRLRSVRWTSTLVDELKERGLAESITGCATRPPALLCLRHINPPPLYRPAGQLASFVDSQKVVVYAGVDPTADSLHVGHLLPLMSLLHFYLHGHRSIGLVSCSTSPPPSTADVDPPPQIGQATAAVGDPSGRTTVRDSIESAALQSSSRSLRLQLTQFFDRAAKYAVSRGYDQSKFGTTHVLTNGDWLSNLQLVDFLSTIGRHVRVSQMLARER